MKNTYVTPEIEVIKAEALELLKAQKDVVQGYVMDEIFNKMKSGSAAVAAYYAGDFLSMYEDNNDLAFFYPEEGTNRYVDAMCVPANSQNKELAMRYINFMCEPDIAYATTSYIGYSTPNTAAYEMLDDEIKNDGISYLDDEYLQKNTTVFRNLSDEANQKMQNLWTELKSTRDETENKWLVPLFMTACVVLSVTILIMRYIKKKKDIF